MLNASNTYGFIKCRYGSESNLKEVATGFFGEQMLKSVTISLILSFLDIKNLLCFDDDGYHYLKMWRVLENISEMSAD